MALSAAERQRNYRERHKAVALRDNDNGIEKQRGRPPAIATELGHTGLKQNAGQIYEEFLPSIRTNNQRIKIYTEMANNDAIISGFLFAINSVLTAVDWHVEPERPDDAEDVAAAKFVSECLRDLDDTWPSDVISEILSMLTYGWCMPPEQEVLRSDGSPIPIRNIKVGDRILTAEGKAAKVKRIYRRQFDGHLVKLRANGYPHALRLTPEHKVPTADGWKTAGELKSGDFLLRPRPQLAPGGDYHSGWLVGLYLAEGNRDSKPRTRINFALHCEEVEEVAARVDAWLEAHGTATWHRASNRANTWQKNNSGRVSVSDPALRALIDKWVGGANAKLKKLRQMPTDYDFAEGIIDGWHYGDGTTYIDKRTDGAIATAATTSTALAHQMQLLAGAIGRPSPMSWRPSKASAAKNRLPTCGLFLPQMWNVGLSQEHRVIYKRTLAAEEEVRALRASGMTLHAIKDAIGLSYTTVWKWLHSDEAKPHGRQPAVWQHAIGHRITEIISEPYHGEVMDLEVDDPSHTFCAGIFGVSNCVQEITYKRRNGRQLNPLQSSKFDDGAWGWRSFSPRAQESLYQWEFDANGRVTAMIQQSPATFEEIRIPMSRALLFRLNPLKGNPEGKALLRGCFRAWFFKKRLQELEGIGIERDLAGLPVMYVDPQLLLPENASNYATYKQVITNLRRDEQEGVILPSVYDADGHKLYELTLLSTGSRRQSASNDVIERYNAEIAMSALSDFMLLGHTRTGAFALSKTKTDLFSTAFGYVLDVIGNEINEREVPRLLALNAMPGQCRLIHGKPGHVDVAAFSGMLLNLAKAGLPLASEDGARERFAFQQLGLPAGDVGHDPTRIPLPSEPTASPAEETEDEMPAA